MLVHADINATTTTIPPRQLMVCRAVTTEGCTMPDVVSTTPNGSYGALSLTAESALVLA